MHLLIYAFLLDILSYKTVFGRTSGQRHEINLINSFTTNNTYEGVFLTQGLYSYSPALLLEGDSRHLELSEEVFRYSQQMLSESNEFTFLAIVQQYEKNSGSILSFSSGNLRFLELQSSGRRDEVRLHYTHNNQTLIETFPYRLADHRWHRIALSVSGTKVTFYVDCNPVYERIIQILDRDLINKNLSLWLGQRNLKHSLFKGILQDVKIIGTPHGYLKQCPALETECPTCGQFENLTDNVHHLLSLINQLTDRLLAAENKIQELEQCECQRSCEVNGTKHRDSESWVEDCQKCTCLKGLVQCDPVECSPVLCKNPIIPKGACCSTCLKQCFLMGVIYDHGEQATPKVCVNCECQDGKMQCKRTDPNVTCPILNCSVEDQFNVPGECCKFCKGMNYCAKGNSCHPNATCINLATRYTCQCNNGFNGDGFVCQDIDECLEAGGFEGHHCHKNSKCVNTIGSYSCECSPGYERLNAFACTEHDECTSDSHQCHEKAVCKNSRGSYVCECVQGYKGNGFHCEPSCNQTCKNGGKCVATNTCACRSGYLGLQCEVDVDECELGIAQCHPNSLCVNMPGWYHCECKKGYYSFHPDNSYGQLCSDINECEKESHTCHGSAQCINTDGGFKCQCPAEPSCSLNCMFEGQEFFNGDDWIPEDNKCMHCTCKDGVVKCQQNKCDCNFKNVETSCCPECDKLSYCHHQELNLVYRNGDRWIYQCQTCECLNGEIDCWNLLCPSLTCNNPIKLHDDCCPICDEHCGNNYGYNSTSSADGCIYQGMFYSDGENWIIGNDVCTTCQCQDGNVCCRVTLNCGNKNDPDRSKSNNFVNNDTHSILSEIATNRLKMNENYRSSNFSSARHSSSNSSTAANTSTSLISSIITTVINATTNSSFLDNFEHNTTITDSREIHIEDETSLNSTTTDETEIDEEY